MFVHAVKELQKAMIHYDELKKNFDNLEKKLVDDAQKKISVPEKRLRKQTQRYQPPSAHFDLTTTDADIFCDTDTEPLETLVPVKVEQEKIPEKEKKTTARSNDNAKKAPRKATNNLKDSPPRKKAKKSPSKCNTSTGIDEKILREVEKLKTVKNAQAMCMFMRFVTIT